MFLSITKELTPASAVRLRLLAQKTAFLYALPINSLLKRDAGAKTITWEKGGWNQYLLQQNLGPIIVPEYELRSTEQASVYCPTLLAAPNIYNLNFTLALTRTHLQQSSSSIKLYLQDTRKQLVVFGLDPIQLPTVRSLFSLATCFYNKFTVYGKIHQLLLENKAILKEQIGPAYLEDLILLFSGQEQKKASSPFTFSPTKPLIEYKKAAFLAEKQEQLGLATTTLFVTRKLREIPITLALRAGNLLTWSFQLPISAPIKKAQFNVFIKEQTEPWLESLEQRTAFGLNIYEKLKLKILLSNT